MVYEVTGIYLDSVCVKNNKDNLNSESASRQLLPQGFSPLFPLTQPQKSRDTRGKHHGQPNLLAS